MSSSDSSIPEPPSEEDVPSPPSVDEAVSSADESSDDGQEVDQDDSDRSSEGSDNSSNGHHSESESESESDAPEDGTTASFTVAPPSGGGRPPANRNKNMNRKVSSKALSLLMSKGAAKHMKDMPASSFMSKSRRSGNTSSQAGASFDDDEQGSTFNAPTDMARFEELLTAKDDELRRMNQEVLDKSQALVKAERELTQLRKALVEVKDVAEIVVVRERRQWSNMYEFALQRTRVKYRRKIKRLRDSMPVFPPPPQITAGGANQSSAGALAALRDHYESLMRQFADKYGLLKGKYETLRCKTKRLHRRHSKLQVLSRQLRQAAYESAKEQADHQKSRRRDKKRRRDKSKQRPSPTKPTATSHHTAMSHHTATSHHDPVVGSAQKLQSVGAGGVSGTSMLASSPWEHVSWDSVPIAPTSTITSHPPTRSRSPPEPSTHINSRHTPPQAQPSARTEHSPSTKDWLFGGSAPPTQLSSPEEDSLSRLLAPQAEHKQSDLGGSMTSATEFLFGNSAGGNNNARVPTANHWTNTTPSSNLTDVQRRMRELNNNGRPVKTHHDRILTPAQPSVPPSLDTSPANTNICEELMSPASKASARLRASLQRTQHLIKRGRGKRA